MKASHWFPCKDPLLTALKPSFNRSPLKTPFLETNKKASEAFPSCLQREPSLETFLFGALWVFWEASYDSFSVAFPRKPYAKKDVLSISHEQAFSKCTPKTGLQGNQQESLMIPSSFPLTSLTISQFPFLSLKQRIGTLKCP